MPKKKDSRGAKALHPGPAGPRRTYSSPSPAEGRSGGAPAPGFLHVIPLNGYGVEPGHFTTGIVDNV